MISNFEANPASGQSVADLEVFLRTAIFKPANQLMGVLLQQAIERIESAYVPKDGEVRKGKVPLLVTGIFGSFTLHRCYYHHAGKKCGHYPADAALGLEVSYTPALARLLCLEGSDESCFQKASKHLKEVGGIQVDERQIQRVINRIGDSANEWQRRETVPEPVDPGILYISADATGVPMRKEELVGRKGKAPDGKAKTRMVMLGCVFTQHEKDENQQPVRDHDSTSYLAAFQSPSDFGVGLRREAIRRGLFSAALVVLLIDGASGLEKLGRDYFPDAIQIVDYFHATSHLATLVSALLGNQDQAAIKRRFRRWKQLLYLGGVDRIILQARKEALKSGNIAEVEAELGYFVNNVERMQYGSFRDQGLFIGSGVIEAGCSSLVGKRCKQSGMFWSTSGAENVLAFRCIAASNHLDDFWKYRRSSLSAQNEPLARAA